MTKRPEALLLAVGLVALIIAGVLACTHQPVPSWDITVIVATLVGGGVATTPGGAAITTLTARVEAAIEQLANHRHPAEPPPAVPSVAAPPPTRSL